MVANKPSEGRKLRTRAETPIKRKLLKSDDEPREKKGRGRPSKEFAKKSDESLESVDEQTAAGSLATEIGTNGSEKDTTVTATDAPESGELEFVDTENAEENNDSAEERPRSRGRPSKKQNNSKENPLMGEDETPEVSNHEKDDSSDEMISNSPQKKKSSKFESKEDDSSEEEVSKERGKQSKSENSTLERKKKEKATSYNEKESSSSENSDSEQEPTKKVAERTPSQRIQKKRSAAPPSARRSGRMTNSEKKKSFQEDSSDNLTDSERDTQRVKKVLETASKERAADESGKKAKKNGMEEDENSSPEDNGNAGDSGEGGESDKDISKSKGKKSTPNPRSGRRSTRNDIQESPPRGDDENLSEEEMEKSKKESISRTRRTTRTDKGNSGPGKKNKNNSNAQDSDEDDIMIVEDFGSPTKSKENGKRSSRLRRRSAGNKSGQTNSPHKLRERKNVKSLYDKSSEDESSGSDKPYKPKAKDMVETSEEEETDDSSDDYKAKAKRSDRSQKQTQKQKPKEITTKNIYNEITRSHSASNRDAVEQRLRHPTKSPIRRKQEAMDSNSSSSSSSIPFSDIVLSKRNVAETTDFQNVGGLKSHIQCLKEIIVYPTLHPETFEQLHMTRAKRILFHGPSGTGKTLLARALANECNNGRRKVTFFKRKGTDYVSDQAGESERHLRILFDRAEKMQPSIIFLDEIDGLSTVESNAKVVSTLLALMDGVINRGEVTVICATNRLDAMNSALRTLGRFDKEFSFMLPGPTERLEILKIHTSKWKNRPEDQLLELLAEKSIGYSGAAVIELCDSLDH